MRVRVVSQVSINSAPAKVFHYLENPRLHFLWNPHLQQIKPLKALSKDSLYTSTSIMLGKHIESSNQVTKFEKSRELQIENNTGLLQYSVNYQLQARSKQTVLICSTYVESTSKAFAFTKPVLKLLAQRELQSDLKSLKLAVENDLE